MPAFPFDLNATATCGLESQKSTHQVLGSGAAKWRDFSLFPLCASITVSVTLGFANKCLAGSAVFLTSLVLLKWAQRSANQMFHVSTYWKSIRNVIPAVTRITALIFHPLLHLEHQRETALLVWCSIHCQESFRMGQNPPVLLELSEKLLWSRAGRNQQDPSSWVLRVSLCSSMLSKSSVCRG